MTTRTIISKSAKKKFSSEVEFPVEIEGKILTKKVIRMKANGFTEQVVYTTQVAKGKFVSVTKHELVR